MKAYTSWEATGFAHTNVEIMGMEDSGWFVLRDWAAELFLALKRASGARQVLGPHS